MTHDESLLKRIESVFAGVTRGNGIDIYAAQASDDYGNPDEVRRSQTAERIDWRRVPHDDLAPRFWAITFLDAVGLRFYTPAIMSAVLQGTDATGCLLEWFLSKLHVAEQGLLKFCEGRRLETAHFRKVFDDEQRAAIIRFLESIVHSDDQGEACGSPTNAVDRLLDLQAYT